MSMNVSRRFGLVTIALVMAGCSPEINRRGYIAKPGAFGQLSEGMSKSEVEGILGSPSTTASIKINLCHFAVMIEMMTAVAAD